MFKKGLAFLMTFSIIFATLGGSVYAESETFKGNDELVNEPFVVVGVSASKLRDKYGDLSDGEIQDILSSGSELIFNNINNNENDFELLRSENKYLDMFDIKIIDNFNNKEVLNDNGTYSLPTTAFDDDYYYNAQDMYSTLNCVLDASGTIHQGEITVESAYTWCYKRNDNGAWGDPTANKNWSSAPVRVTFDYRVGYIHFGVSQNGYIYIMDRYKI